MDPFVIDFSDHQDIICYSTYKLRLINRLDV